MSHYFKNDSALKSQKRIIEYNYDQYQFKFNSDNGVFSKSEIDEGSVALIKSTLKQELKSPLLDLGCGYGTIGIIIKKIINTIDIDMVDINQRAVCLAKENCITNKVENNVFESDGFIQINRQYHTILLNPPIRAGKIVIFKMFEDSYHHLLVGGKLLIVMRKSHGAKSAMTKIEELFKNCELLNKDKGYYIFMATKLD